VIRLCLLLALLYSSKLFADNKTCAPTLKLGQAYYVAPNGTDYKADGSISNPWKTINYALFAIPDGNTLIVRDGIYAENIKISKKFDKGLLLKAEIPYRVKLTSNQRVLALVKAASNIIIEGFEITHNTQTAKPIVVHIDGWGGHAVNNITLRNNIIHDSYNNDLLKINYGAEDIIVECNMFYNQGDSDEHIDINSVANVIVRDNIFFNDFPKSNRQITSKSSSFIVIKDSNDNEDRFHGAENITIKRNIFLNWQGSHGQGFILVGEDGKPYYEAHNINIYNNLMLGNSPISMRAPFMIKGARDINFFNNTISGDLPSNAFAIRVTQEQQNKKPTNINLYNNIWSDPTGTMGQGTYENSLDFSDTPLYQLNEFTLNSNWYWNNGNKLPYSLLDAINPNDDHEQVNSNPLLGDNEKLTTPVWNGITHTFADGSFEIREAFLRLVSFYGIPKLNHHKRKFSINHKSPAPRSDILNKTRKLPQAIGAYHVNSEKKVQLK
tara:strand:+ start:31119 stop:32606 length:1488 start_codon:yes stop_codon:yes gene_type:complete